MNFELLNPAPKRIFGKYYDLLRKGSRSPSRERFLEFEALVGRLLPA